ncbi:MAG: DUF4346 domain-containing protein [Nanoarchaeota archaeon]
MSKEIIKGKFHNIEKDIKRVIHAHFDRIKEFKLDPKGYFLIKIDKKTNTIHAGYCTNDNVLKAEIIGKTAIEVVNTIIREGLVLSLQHAADLGIELHKAEIALKKGLDYVQDSPLAF